MKRYLIDTETTGLVPEKGELTEISILRLEDMTQKIWEIRIEHPEWCQPRALEITNKTVRELMSRGKYLAEVVPMVNRFLNEDGVSPEERIMIAHHYSFDQRFCEAMWKRVGEIFPAKMWECTLAMSRKYIKDKKLDKGARLEDMLVKLGIKGETEDQHTAAVDVRNTYLIREALLKRGMVELEFMYPSQSYIDAMKEKNAAIDATTEFEDDPAMEDIYG